MSLFPKESVLMLEYSAFSDEQVQEYLIAMGFRANPLSLLERKRDTREIITSWQWLIEVSAAVLLNGFKIFKKYVQYLGYPYLAPFVYLF